MNVASAKRKVRVGDIAEFRNGVNYLSSGAGHFVKVVGVADFPGKDQLNEYDDISTIDLIDRISEEDELRDGDILFVRSNGSKDLVGRSLFVRNPPRGATFSGFTIRLRVNSDRIIPEYLALCSRNDAFRKSMLMAGGGNGNISNISQSMLADIEIDLISLEHQRSMVDFFELVGKELSCLEMIVSYLNRQYRISIASMMPSVPGKHSGGWGYKKLGDLFKERDERGLRVQLLAVSGLSGVIPRNELSRRDTSAADKSNYKKVRKGDIAYNTMRMWQGVCGLSRYDGIVSPAYTVVTPIKDKILGEFAEHLFRHPRVIHDFWRYSQGMVDDTLLLKYPHFSEIRVPIPDIPTQRRIANALSSQRRHIEVLEKLVEKHRERKRALMQQLLTGKKRLVDEAPKRKGSRP